MLEFLKRETKVNMTYTENGAVTYETTDSACLDMFSCAGALRQASKADILARFQKAFDEDADTAMKLLFFTRDIRGGLGERRVFRTIVHWLAFVSPKSLEKNIFFFSELGRYDDLLSLFGTPAEAAMISEVKRVLTVDLAALEKGRPITLLGKWLPSINASSQKTRAQGKKLAKALDMSEEQYRKTLTKLRGAIRILENNLREKDYTFDYETQPSRALFKYRKAFFRNDGERYNAYLSAVSEGKAYLNAENVSPYELILPYLNWDYNTRSFVSISSSEAKALNATWSSLPEFPCAKDSLAVIDTSGSMYSSCAGAYPAAVALSLGLYFSERNEGVFKNHYISFSRRPQLIEIKGKTFVEKLRYVTSKSEVADTNVEAVFDLILDTAVKYHLKQKDLPKRIFLISDMEFNFCAKNAEMTNFEAAKERFERAGYKLPQLIFWNVNARHQQVPVRSNEQGVVLLSGVTPMLFSMVTSGKIDPYSFMLKVLNSPRYNGITA